MAAKSRMRNSMFNMMGNFLYYFVNVLVGMISRKVLIMTMGIEYQGINGLFTNILSILNIVELGIGTAIVYHLYKPLKEKNLDGVAACMNFYRKCYNAIALIIAVFGGVLVFFLDFFVGENELPINMQIVYLMMLAEIVISYTFTYKRSILYADQRNYCVSAADTIYIVVNGILGVFILIFTHNYYLYLAIKIVLRIVENIAINIYVNKTYDYLKSRKNIKIKKEILDDIILKIKGLLCHKIGTYVVSGTDNILISKFVSIKAVGIYSNYALIITSIEGIFGRFIDATVASVGNLLVDNDYKKNMSVFRELRLVNLAITNFTTSSLLCMCTTFISFYFGSDYILNLGIVIVLMFNYMLNNLRKVYGVFKTAAGIQYEDRFVPIIEAIVNLVASLIFIHFFGFIGVFLGTSLSNAVIYGYTFPFLIYRNVLGGKVRDYFIELIRDIFTVIGCAIISMIFVTILSTDKLLIMLIIEIVICLIIPNAIFVILYHNHEAFGLLKNRFLMLFKRKGKVK